jgi:hypothetical protein
MGNRQRLSFHTSRFHGKLDGLGHRCLKSKIKIGLRRNNLWSVTNFLKRSSSQYFQKVNEPISEPGRNEVTLFSILTENLNNKGTACSPTGIASRRLRIAFVFVIILHFFWTCYFSPVIGQSGFLWGESLIQSESSLFRRFSIFLNSSKS